MNLWMNVWISLVSPYSQSCIFHGTSSTDWVSWPLLSFPKDVVRDAGLSYDTWARWGTSLRSKCSPRAQMCAEMPQGLQTLDAADPWWNWDLTAVLAWGPAWGHIIRCPHRLSPTQTQGQNHKHYIPQNKPWGVEGSLQRPWDLVKRLLF